MNEHFSIIGAGIGGLTIALTLKQRGFSFSVYESADEIKPVGAGIILASNAMQVMKKLGLQEKLEFAGNRVSCMKITDQNLKALSVVDLSRFEKKYHVSNLAIHRGDLQQILANEIGFEHINLSKRVAKIERSTPYNLTFEDNSTLLSKVLIGADGIKSIVRNQLFPKAMIRNANQVCWRGVCEINLPGQYHNELNEAWGKGKRFGFVKLKASKVYWFALISDKNKEDKGDNLPQLFSAFHPDILSIINATPSNNIIKSEITDLKPIKNWQAENICLVGDSAHAATPNLGQGACQAIEDAYVLGNCLETAPNPQTAFKNYEQLRMKKALMIVKGSWQVGKIAHIESNPGVWIRNNLMKYMPERMNKKQMEKIFDLKY
jgi:2-polyprenyl-6-methoxyphenol hydroxylase-like FAD-dependent oxidoreductase